MARSLLPVLGALLLAWIALLIAMSAMEQRFLYFPVRTLEAQPSDYGLRSEELRVTTSDGVRLHGWWIRAGGSLVVLLFHGNAGNISHRLDRAKLFAERLGVDLFLVDYRGYGRSGGKPSEEGLYFDGLAIYDAARERGFPSNRIVLLGESLGCAVAAEVALARPVAAVALETPFLSVPALARKHYPFVPTFLVRSKFDTEATIGRLTVPKLILAAERDEIAPPSHARRLFDLARPPKELFVIPGAGHNDTYVAGGEPYLEVWRRFLNAIDSTP
ncbi:MAG TPA: alpha/beta hydrolase [Thermoanaerobaculia bacterium]|nr:alpha/beta hydrolase [Thermoanaerobaculia bacterium]